MARPPARQFQTPRAGEIAPAFGSVQWLQLDDGKTPEMVQLRGKVVVVSTFAHWWETDKRAGIPLANAIRQSNPGEVRVIGITGQEDLDETHERIVEKARELGITHSVALGDLAGTWTPYLNAQELMGTTWAYVITRSGGVLWAGDPSSKPGDYLAAVAEARNQVPTEPLPEKLAPELAPAVALYVRGDFTGCEASTASILKKLGSKGATDAVRADAAKLTGLIEATRKNLMDELERSVGDDKPESYTRAAENVARAFPKGPCADRAGQLEMVMYMQRPHGPTCKKWSQWFALSAARPANFPAEKDKTTAKYAKELAKYLKGEEPVHGDQAQKWLDAFANAVERK